MKTSRFMQTSSGMRIIDEGARQFTSPFYGANMGRVEKWLGLIEWPVGDMAISQIVDGCWTPVDADVDSIYENIYDDLWEDE